MESQKCLSFVLSWPKVLVRKQDMSHTKDVRGGPKGQGRKLSCEYHETLLNRQERLLILATALVNEASLKRLHTV
jgi:hypothetical protein